MAMAFARPWCQLKPTTGGPDVSFPALIPRRYFVIEGKENGYVLSEEKRELIDSVVIEADKDRKVFFVVGKNSRVGLQINEKAVEKGATSSELKQGDTVQLGIHAYAFKRTHCRVAEIRSAFRELVRCSICLRACQDLTLLKCGHTFCSLCVNQMIRLAMVDPAGQIYIDPSLPPFIEQGEILQQSRTITCGICRKKITCWEASRSCQPAELAKAVKAIGGWIDFEEIRPKCMACHDGRCFANLRDYEYCERCRLLLCPACAVEGHRNHEFRDRELIVRNMHDAGKRFMGMKIQFAQLKAQKAGVRHKLDTILDEFVTQHDDTAPAVKTGVEKCEELVTQIEERRQPFATVDAKSLTSFDSAVQEARVVFAQVDDIIARLRNSLDEAVSMISENEQ